MTRWERQVTEIAERYGLEVRRAAGRSTHYRLINPRTGQWRPVSATQRCADLSLRCVERDAKRIR